MKALLQRIRAEIPLSLRQIALGQTGLPGERTPP